MINYFENTARIIEQFNVLAEKGYGNDNQKEIEFLMHADFEMAKALILDWDQAAVRIAKMILAHHDINEVKIKIE